MKIDLQISNPSHPTLMKNPQLKFAIRLTICAAAMLLSNRFCLAQDPCPNNGEVHPTSEETLAGQYQPGYPNDPPPVLERFRFLPPGAGQSQTFPTVLVLPPDIFKLEYQDRSEERRVGKECRSRW